MTRTNVCVRIARAALMAVLAWGAVALTPAPGSSQSLRGSSVSLDRQNVQARRHDFTYIDTAARVRYFAEQGWLVRIRPDRNFTLHAVSFPYARPELELFIKRLAAQYRAACGEQLVVTSLTRPISRQPRNASVRSVHPTGMAVDLRYSRDRNCRSWLERVLLSLEGGGVLEATRERYPPHYHVAVFPQPYSTYVERIVEEAPRRAQQVATRVTVRRGDSLWTIARRHGTTVENLKSVNNLRGSRIYAGQVLQVPSPQ